MSNIPHKDFSEAELMTAISLSNMEAGNGKKSGKSNHNHSYTNVNSNQNHHHHDTHDDDNTVEDRSATGPDEGGEGKRKIKFKRAKKLHRAASALYAKQMKDLQASRFQQWSKAELVDIMIQNKIELRNEDQITKESLRDLCDALYEGREMPERPKQMGMMEIVMANVMARRIQNVWIIYQLEKRIRNEEQQSQEYMNRLSTLENNDMAQIGNLDYLYRDGNVDLVDVPDTDLEAPTTPTGSQRLASGDVEEAKSSLVAESASKKEMRRRKKAANILDIPWTAPDWQKAKKYADYVQPRKGGKGGTRFDYNETTTGRHCCIGGLGEQFDLWQEGQISEFSIYGSGVTNYFKFIKWCFWLFFVLAVLSLPQLILNIYGPDKTNSGLKELASTTVGNLAENIANTTVSITIPGCTGYGVFNVDCNFDRDSLAAFYMYLEIIISGTIFIAYIWLRVFEKQEEKALDKNTVNASMFTLCISRIPEDTTEEELASHFQKLLRNESAVATVCIAYDNADEIRECTARGDIIRAKVRLVHEHRYHCTRMKLAKSESTAEKLIEKSRNDFFERMKRLNEDLKKKENLLEQYARKPMRAIIAYVTFNKVEQRNIVEHRYNGMSIYQYLCYDEKLKFRGKRLLVRDAPEPSTIIWENLGYKYSDRFCRRAFTTILSLLLIVVSFVVILGAEVLQVKATNESNGQERECPESFFGDSKAEQQQTVENDPTLLHCYCDQLSPIRQSNDSLCKDYLERNINAQILTFFASLVVLMVNFLIEKSLKAFCHFEKHFTEDSKGRSVFIRLFILKFINTGLVFLVNNNATILNGIFQLKVDGTVELTSSWFNNIGTTIILVQMGDIFFNHGDKFLKYLWYYRKLRKARTDRAYTLTQDELNKMQVGPQFEFAFNYAQLLSTIFVCLAYSTGIPLLYILGASNFLVFYFVEKYLFTNLYTIPPHFNAQIGKRATSFIPLALIFHLAVAVWVLSNEELFSNKTDERTNAVDTTLLNGSLREKLTGEHTFPLVVFLLIIILIRVVGVISKRVYQYIDQIIDKFCACFKRKNDPQKATGAQAIVTYSRAVQRNLIKGLSTYNVLQNPRYKDAFAITWKFAVANKHVRSVRLLKSKAQEGEEEEDAAKAEKLQRSHLKEVKNRNRSFYSSFYQQAMADSNTNALPSSGKHHRPRDGARSSGDERREEKKDREAHRSSRKDRSSREHRSHRSHERKGDRSGERHKHGHDHSDSDRPKRHHRKHGEHRHHSRDEHQIVGDAHYSHV